MKINVSNVIVYEIEIFVDAELCIKLNITCVIIINLIKTEEHL